MKKSYFSFLVVLFLAFTVNVSAQTPITDANIHEAVDLWVSDQTSAEATYGHISNWNTSNVTDMSSLFSDKTSFNENIGNWDVSNVTNMWGMFYKSGFNQPIGNWDVSSVTDMAGMFSEAPLFNQDISNWDVSHVIEMRYMFFETQAFNQPIGDWDVSGATDMENMFLNATSFSTENYDNLLESWATKSLQPNVILTANLTTYCNGATARDHIINTYGWTITDGGLDCPSLTPITDENINEAVGLWVSDQATAEATYGHISNWDTSNVTNMFGLFAGLDIDWSMGNWDVSNVTNMSWMFESSSFNQLLGIGDWDVSSVTNMSTMFENSNFNEHIGNWNVSSVTDMSSMFYGASEFNQPLEDWDVSNVTDMSFMFKIFGEVGYSYFNQPIGNWNVSSVTDMSSMFYEASEFNQPIGDWDVSSVTDMSGMFGAYNDYTSFNQPIGNWDVSSVTNMSSMFYSCAFNQDIGNWDVSNVTDMSHMFYSDMFNGFNKPIGNWDVSNVTDMAYMFAVSESEESFFNQPIEDWDVSNVTNMEGMFKGKQNFNQPIANWDVSSVTNMSRMFQESTFNPDIGNWDVSSVTNMSLMFFINWGFNQDISGWDVSSVTDMREMFWGATSFSTANYDNLLTGWATKTLQPNVNFSVSASYCNGETARDYIINTYGWTITDGGKDCANTAVNCLTVEDANGYLGISNNINLRLESSEIIKGFQFDITLPDGFVFNPNDITKTGLPENFQVSSSNVGGNVYRVVGFSLANETIASGTASILTFPTLINEGTLAGEYPIPVTSVTLSDVNNVDIATACPTDGVITVYSYPMGDSNGDDTVNILDILGTVDYIFDNPPALFYFELADVNADATINILDVLEIQDIILSPPAAKTASIKTAGSTAKGLAGANYLVVNNDSFSPITSGTIEILLENEDDVKGLQFDFVLPEGFTFNPSEINGSSRLDGFIITAQEISANTYRVVVFSLTGAIVDSGTGLAFNIPIFIEPDMSSGVYAIPFTEVTISDTNNTNASTTAPSIGEITINSTLGIDDIEDDENTLTIYPNPANETLYVKIDRQSSYSIIDVYGKLVKTGKVEQGENKLDIKHYQTGIYFLQIMNELGTVTKKVIKE